MYSFVAFAVYTSVTQRLIVILSIYSRTKGQTEPATKDGMIAYLPGGFPFLVSFFVSLSKRYS